ncbi:uncharacterized protein A1O5_04265 [Cladophialophora psammophila CBS 110553]|uniref:Uncharacterized protein n=1 Tax=Cladophialophora psammophila CBS 110553 TaxID=1182543 RepID=W9X859_9EURO|nr:uncharacterized protein A1O5_04265 [Cladophialophora psammophila CBS 110553]EXJ73116.1 hypothetical protein A1O5_04265 [Cladophialophora psammophila CBS 110553]
MDALASTLVEPIRASMLLDMERPSARRREMKPEERPPASEMGDIQIEGLDRSFAALWSGGRVVGVGSAGKEEDNSPKRKRPLALQTLAAALLNSQVQTRSSPIVLPSSPATLLNVYLVTPHTSQAIPMLHVLLANTMSNSQAAIELLKPVRLLQYFDLEGLAESLAEVSQDLYRRTQANNEPVGADCGNRTGLEDIVLVQGLGQTVSATHRRSGLIQSNALLGDLTRNITQISRISRHILVLVEVALEIGAAHEAQLNQAAPRSRRAHAAIGLESAFAGSGGKSLRLYSGHELLSRTLEAALDCIVVEHDGFGRVNESRRCNESREQVVEVVKDRVGDLMGLWDVWKGG